MSLRGVDPLGEAGKPLDLMVGVSQIPDLLILCIEQFFKWILTSRVAHVSCVYEVIVLCF